MVNNNPAGEMSYTENTLKREPTVSNLNTVGNVVVKRLRKDLPMILQPKTV